MQTIPSQMNKDHYKNIAMAEKEIQYKINEHKKKCVNDYYKSMSIQTAYSIKRELLNRNRPSIKSKLFVKRINEAKGYEFI